MTISTTDYEVTYNGDDSTTEFAPSWTIEDDDDIEVYIIDESNSQTTLKTKTTHYTVEIDSVDKTFTVTMNSAPTSDEKLYIRLNKSRTQDFDPAYGGALDGQGVESELDQMNRSVRSLESDINRSLKAPYGVSGDLGTSFTAEGLLRVKSDYSGFETVSLSALDLTATYDFSSLDELTSGTVATATDQVLIHDVSTNSTKYITPDNLLAAANPITASNEGASGVGVFVQKTGDNLEFRNINTGSTKVTITDDSGNNEIDIDVDSGKILEAEVGSSGLMTRTASETFTNRSIAAGDGVSVSNGDGVSGNPTVALDVNGLTTEASLEAGDFVAGYDTSAGALRKFAVDDIGPLADINGMTADSSPVLSTDYIIVYDASSGTNKKVLLKNIFKASDGVVLYDASVSASSADVILTMDFNVYKRFKLYINANALGSEIFGQVSDDGGSTYYTSSSTYYTTTWTSGFATTWSTYGTDKFVVAHYSKSQYEFLIERRNTQELVISGHGVHQSFAGSHDTIVHASETDGITGTIDTLKLYITSGTATYDYKLVGYEDLV